ncbi:MAG: molybdopterin oxidoreductase family protein [Halorhodospira halophila]|uniref:molybdopterin oxidoreductase family protein n=1 Tax=Halorhodospira TaxID=85108 RepID=UPI001A9347FB|nr:MULTISPECIES: molybdopterin oxidoreductase family protein [Halorhodospira]MBK5936531.1 formate dehydrogenase [Halorhodospira halophila]MBK5944248.1 formate dehydrogenase [Halorhodospira halophila]MCC3750039.1 molybdopterin oxidoreductase family protein [Halorhodospira halophila]
MRVTPQAEVADDPARLEPRDRQEVRYTTCYMCACRCGIQVTLEDGQVRFIQGNPDHPVNRGVLCAKGNAGIMKQNSRAKLRRPLRRKPGTERGEGAFEEISWDEALDELTERLRRIRAEDPKKLAYFTGRDQMQALTGLWATQFGTINWAAHGGFCSVNMAAAGLYTLGHAFWEFGDPDFERTRYFLLWGTAEDHASNPFKLGIDTLKRRGGRFVAINPVRTGYQAVADEWVPIRPGTDGMLAMSLIHCLLRDGQFDQDYLIRYTNAPYLVVQTPGQAGDGLFLRDEQGAPLVRDLQQEAFVDGTQAGIAPALFGAWTAPDGRPVKTAMTLLAERYLDAQYAPERAAEVCGVPAETIERLAAEMAHVAFQETIEIECEWTDWAGRRHDRFIGRPVSMHAMRGVSAHSNGFQAARALHLLQLLLGSVDCPGGHRAKPPYPKPIPPPLRPARETAPDTPLAASPLGFPVAPEDLVIDGEGRPLRIDKAFSWEAPVSPHGKMHTVISNAHDGDPYPIDTLMLFMANMAWNSTMNTTSIQDMLRARDESGAYRIPYLVVVDAFHSETVQYADLVLPDTTYLERHDCISMLDRPISTAEGPADAIRQPILEPEGEARPWQEVMIELGARLGLPAFTNEDGSPKYSGYEDFIVRFEKAPGVGFLAGWRGEDGSKPLRGEPNPRQWEHYIENGGFFQYELPLSHQFYKFANKGYLEWAEAAGINGSAEPMVMSVYAEPLQRFRLAAEGLYDGPQPQDPVDRERVRTYCDPLPFHYAPLEQSRVEGQGYTFHAITQRPMTHYHAWDSQNAWLRQIMAENVLYMNRARGEALGLSDGDWVWVESHNGRICVPLQLVEGVQADTVWTWNAVGKRSGAWGLEPGGPEASRGFLLNHLIDDRLPRRDDEKPLSNSDPITGQAAWYDLQVRIHRAAPGEGGISQPQFTDLIPPPGVDNGPMRLMRYATHQAVRLHRSMRDILSRGR